MTGVALKRNHEVITISSFLEPSGIVINHCAVFHQGVIQIFQQQNWETILIALLETGRIPSALVRGSHVILTFKILAYNSGHLQYGCVPF